MKSIKILLTSFIMLMFMMMMTTKSPMLMWTFMEMGNLMFMFMVTMNQKNTSSVMSLFLMQNSSSMMMMLGILNNYPSIMTLSIILKLGLFPFHPWMPMIMKSSSWFICLLIMTLQKIPPFLFMMHTTNPLMLCLSVTMTPIVSMVKLINSPNVKMIISFSSLIHSSWMTISMITNPQIWMIYFMFYSINMWIMCNLMKKYYSTNFTMMMKSSKMLNYISMMLLFSMIGTPPVTLFLAKLMMFKKLTMIMTMPIMTLMTSSAISIMFYSRLMKHYLFFNHPINKSTQPPQNSTTLAILSVLMFSILMILI